MKPRERRKLERPGEILEAAFEEFAEHGFAATRLEDVARRAGVTKGTVYFYFESKERVFEEMIGHFSRQLESEADEVLAAPARSQRERLSRFIEFYYRRFATDRYGREMLRFMIADGKHFPDLVNRHYSDFVAPAIQRIQELVQAGVDDGEFRAAPVAQYAEIVIAPAVLMGLWLLVFAHQKEIDFEAFARAHIDLVLNGLLSGADKAGTPLAAAGG